MFFENKENVKFYKKYMEHYEWVAEYYRKLVKKQKNENEQLKKEIFKLKLKTPSEFPIGEIGRGCANAAWYNEEGEKRTFVAPDGTKIVFEGRVYESSYENYTADFEVYVVENNTKNYLLSIDSHCVDAYRVEVEEKGSLADIRKWLVKKNMPFTEIMDGTKD